MSTLSLVFADYVQLYCNERCSRADVHRLKTGPWVDRAPVEIVRSNIRFSLQPIDAPTEPDVLNRLFEHMQSDELVLFSADDPHWQFEGDEVLSKGLSNDLVRKIMIDNPLTTYSRLKQTAMETTR